MSLRISELVVFVASPGDLGPERLIARAAANEVNANLGSHLGCQIRLLGWEDTTPGYVRPQDKINQDVDSCDLFLGMLWKRWGEPPGDSQFTSGFEEEFERAVARRRGSGSPEICIYLKHITSEETSDPGLQLSKVISFRSKLSGQRELFYKQFGNGGPDVGELLRSLFSSELLKASRGDPQAAATPPPTAVEEPDEEVGPDATVQITEAMRFANALALDSAVLPEGSSKRQFARFILASAAVETRWWVSTVLGAHQSNIIYTIRAQLKLSLDEHSLLFRSGLPTDEYRPAWYWMRDARPGTVNTILVGIAKGDSNPTVRVGALEILRRFHPVKGRARLDLLQHARESDDDRIELAVLHFLKLHGVANDLWFLDQSAGRSRSYAVEQEARRVAEIIRWRDDSHEQLREIVQNGREVVAESLPEALPSLPLELLAGALINPQPAMRKLAIEAIARHHSAYAEEPLWRVFRGDSDRGVVEAAFRALSARGIAFDEDQIKARLPAPQGWGSWFFDTEASIDNLLEFELAKYSSEELKLRTEQFGDTGAVAFKLMVSKGGEAARHFALQELEDGFQQTRMDYATVPTVSDAGAISAVLSALFPLARYRIAALDGLRLAGSSVAISVARRLLTEQEQDVCEAAAYYLAEFGTNADGLAILSRFSTKLYLVVAMVPVMVRRGTLTVEMLEEAGAPEIAVAEGIAAAPAVRFSSDFDRVFAWLRSSSSGVRVSALRKISASWQREQLESVLNKYLESEVYYYNVVLWLDRVLYTPRAWRRGVLTWLHEGLGV